MMSAYEQKKHARIAQILADIPKDEKIYYKPNPGNGGDALIAVGTFELFGDLGLNVEIIQSEEDFDSSGKIVIYAGGGNLNHIYHDARDFILKIHSRAKLFILLPHTVTENEDLLAELGGNCILFAREITTYEYLKEKCSEACRVYLDHDMALYIDSSKLLKNTYPSIPALVLKKIIRKLVLKKDVSSIPSVKQLMRIYLFEARIKETTCRFYRKDAEASGNVIGKSHGDISAIYELGTSNKWVVYYTAWKMMTLLGRFDFIETDRLHVAIAAMLAHTKVRLYSGNYYKIQAIYDYSLSDQALVEYCQLQDGFVKEI